MKKAWKWASFSLLLLPCQGNAAPTPSATYTPPPTAEPTRLPPQTPQADRTHPPLFAENGRWMVYLDDWVKTEADGSVMDLSICEKDGTLYQKLRSCSDHTGPHPWWHLDNEGIDPPVLLTDLNFDGVDDIRVDYETIRCGAYAAFLWDEEEGRFVEEPTFAEIKAPRLIDGMVFSRCSGGASHLYYDVYSYSREAGYQLLRSLHLDSDGEQMLYIESRYENGVLVDTIESLEDLRQNHFGKNYVEPSGFYIWE